MRVSGADRGESLHLFFERRQPLHLQRCMSEPVFAIPINFFVGPSVDDELKLLTAVPLRTVIGITVDVRLVGTEGAP